MADKVLFKRAIYSADRVGGLNLENMFSKRHSFSQYYKFNKIFLEKLVSDLKLSGFIDVRVKLPHNLLSDDRDEILIEEFLDRGRNYPSIILIGKTEDGSEIIKVLFINTSTKAFFKDDTYPSGHSEPPELYVQSRDPARTYALFGFFYDYLKSNSKTSGFFSWLLFISSSIFLISEYGLILGNRKTVLSTAFSISPAFDFISVLIAIYFIFHFYKADRGLYVKEHEDKLASGIRRAIKGEFKDNPVINLLISIIGPLVATIILKMTGFFL